MRTKLRLGGLMMVGRREVGEGKKYGGKGGHRKKAVNCPEIVLWEFTNKHRSFKAEVLVHRLMSYLGQD